MNTDDLPINSPCGEDWEAMDGDGKRRFCSVCDKHVHDLSEMTEPEASSLLDESDNLCVRYTPENDGQIRFRPSRRQLVRAAAASVFVGLATPLAAQASGAVRSDAKGLLATLQDWLFGEPEGCAAPETPHTPEVLMGDVAWEPEPLEPAPPEPATPRVKVGEVQAPPEPPEPTPEPVRPVPRPRMGKPVRRHREILGDLDD